MRLHSLEARNLILCCPDSNMLDSILNSSTSLFAMVRSASALLSETPPAHRLVLRVLLPDATCYSGVDPYGEGAHRVMAAEFTVTSLLPSSGNNAVQESFSATWRSAPSSANLLSRHHQPHACDGGPSA